MDTLERCKFPVAKIGKIFQPAMVGSPEDTTVDASEIPRPTTGWMFLISVVDNTRISTTNLPQLVDSRRISGCHQHINSRIIFPPFSPSFPGHLSRSSAAWESLVSQLGFEARRYRGGSSSDEWLGVDGFWCPKILGKYGKCWEHE